MNLTKASLSLLTALLLGCGHDRLSPYAEQSSLSRDTAKAQELNQKAADLIQTDPEKAEHLLHEALTHDLHFGPAHNNLGVIFLAKGNLYEASSEFEWARKLMPGHPDPRINLAIALERGGQIEDAIATYEAVLETRPDLDAAMIGLASTQLRHRQTDDRTAQLLGKIARDGKDPAIRQWALDQQARLTKRMD
ncbi:MAG: tetratricopeptide repeat protein [Phycisphaerales bacterium]|nr:tetratricopeptide repeat protein [Phycisphaerales bacterium]MCB9837097.1 tetratricopeptide repeat protein [Phycisphaera sp.]